MLKHAVTGIFFLFFGEIIRFYSKEFPVEPRVARVARLISTGVRSLALPTDRYQNSRNTACNVSIVVSGVTSVVHIRRQTAWNAPKASYWIQDIESANNTPLRKAL